MSNGTNPTSESATFLARMAGYDVALPEPTCENSEYLEEVVERIEALSNIGRYLALWNASTGLPTTNPQTMPFAYQTGEYYIVSSVAGNTTHNISLAGTASEHGISTGTYSVSFSLTNSTHAAYTTISSIATALADTSVSATGVLHTTDGDITIVGVLGWEDEGNMVVALLDEGQQKIALTLTTADTLTDTVSGGVNYKPSGTSYTGAASTTVESNTLVIGDMYRYDGSSWELLKYSAAFNWSNINGKPFSTLDSNTLEVVSNVLIVKGKLISSIAKTSTSGLVDTYTITYTDTTTSTFTVTNGKSISSIAKTSTSGLVDTYTITYNDSTTSTFTVTNGEDGVDGVDGDDGRGITSILKTGTSGLVDTYTITYTDSTTSTFTVTNGADGDDGRGISSISKTSTSGSVDTYTITYTDSTTSTFTVTNGSVTSVNGQTGAVTGLAETDGYYDTLSVGLADNLIDRKGTGDSRSFTFDTACGDASIGDDGNAIVQSVHGNTIVTNQLVHDTNENTATGDGFIEVTDAVSGSAVKNEFIGETIVMNQLVENGNFADTSGWGGGSRTFTVANNVGTILASALNGGINTAITFISGHKYLCAVSVKTTTVTTGISLRVDSNQDSVLTTETTSWQNLSLIHTGSGSANYFRVVDTRSSDWDSFDVKNAMLIDLTQMFGSGNEPTTVAEAKAKIKALNEGTYIPYNTGSLVSNNSKWTSNVWNQLSPYIETGKWSKANSVTDVQIENGIISGIATAAYGSLMINGQYEPNGIVGHKYFAALDIKTTGGSVVYMKTGSRGGGAATVVCDSSTDWQRKEAIFTAHGTGSIYLGEDDARSADWDRVYVKEPNIVDLTALFGSGNEPETIDELKAICSSWGKDLDTYQAYDAGTAMGGTFDLASIQPKSAGTAHDVFNAQTGVMTHNIGSITITSVSRSSTVVGNYSSFGVDNVSRAFDTSDFGYGLLALGAKVIHDEAPTSSDTEVCIRGQVYDGKAIWIYIPTASASTIAEANTYLAAHPITLYYALLTPTTETLTAQTYTLQTGTNNLYQTDGDILNTEVDLTYTGTDYTITTSASDKFLFRDNGTDSIQTNKTSFSVVGGTDKLINLTRMFGSGNEPSTVAGVYHFFPKWQGANLPYNAGTLISYIGTGIKTVGFNQLDSNGHINVIAGQTYHIEGTYTSLVDSNGNAVAVTNNNFTPTKNDTYTMVGGSCVHLQWSGYRDGDTEDYETHTLSLPISTYFANGMRSAGSVYDELTKNKAITRIGSQSVTGAIGDTITLTGCSTSATSYMCAKGDIGTLANGVLTLTVAVTSETVLFALATPTEVTISPALDFTYSVADFGTEQSLPENTALVPVTSPFNGVIKYSEDFTRDIVNLPKNYQSQDSMDSLLTALGTACNGTFTKTWDSTNNKWSFTFTST